jgi:Na+-driven multidrug efflux pump
MVLIPDVFIRMFISDPAVVIPGAQCLRIISIGFLAYGFGMVLVHAFNGAGDTRTPTWINFICFWIIEIPLAYLLAISFGIGEQGVFYAIVISETLLTFIAFVMFKKGKWKENKV